ncbi:MAG: DNA polymerase III subunit alpha [Candidatus Shapirobacteria bacterium]|nr:DNA polymerase III subunit alpha [Candidatus Shapirobacteria bacterium]MDD5073718.1 DNA polymerase III subunit alpha [Candidatus Shapirobacteria bacterium]MDD5481707.1 DNA polymerase III subunit alpha [Candidatus Shapirobacteria bacterium]
MAKKDFVHLHVHSDYSLLDGLAKTKEIAPKTKELGMKSIALTDHGVMYGAIKFYNSCRYAGIKPIIGCEMYLAPGEMTEKAGGPNLMPYHLVLLAKDFTGYQNLMALVTKAHLEGFYYKPRVDIDLLKKHSKGLIALSACLHGLVPALLLEERDNEAAQRAKELYEIFAGDFYLEIQNHPKIADQDRANKKLVALSRSLGIPLVATNDVHYLDRDDAQAQDALMAIGMQKTIDDPNRLSMLDSPDFYLKSPEEMWRDFADFPDALDNTIKIADMCQLEIPLGKAVYPSFPLPKGETSSAIYLKNFTYQQAEIRYSKVTKEIKERIDYELKIITNMGYADYFLIVQDYVNWAKKQGIRVGPGRGSGAGSIVAYILRITSVDPLFHVLPFERFLNPERKSTPDFDIDFSDDRRDEVINYVRDKYGQEHVANIITFGTIESRMAVRDIARVLNFPYSTGDRIAKMIPAEVGKKISIDEALRINPELKIAYETETETKRVLDLSKRIVGVARHASTHAAGVVLADKPLVNYTPLQLESKGDRVTTQYDMYSLDLNIDDDAIGLLKMDFLGLRNLTILERAIDFVVQTEKKRVDVSEIPLDDKNVYQMISRGETTGVFQLESEGMRRLAKKLLPNRFSDLSAMVALFRPGPMQFIDDFVNRKKNPRLVDYPHPKLRSILEETYGIIVYQEQIMQIAHTMAGFSLGRADLLRRAIGKKKLSIMKSEKKDFIAGCLNNGYPKQVAEAVFTMIEKFASYGFNKAHSASYAMIAYQTAWMKTHYPVEFTAAVLSAESGRSERGRLILAIDECRRMGVDVLPPNINVSKENFTIEEEKGSLENKAIRLGLSVVKNVGEAAITTIVAERKNGPFASLSDFCLRVDSQKANKKVIESLIRVGAMDSFGKRSSLLAGLENIRIACEKEQKNRLLGQTSLFGQQEKKPATQDRLPIMEEFPKQKLQDFENELLGFSLNSQPLWDQELANNFDHKNNSVEDLPANSRVKLLGIINNVRVVFTKRNNEEMAFLNLEDETGTSNIVVFPKIYRDNKEKMVNGNAVVVVGKIDKREEEKSVLADEIYTVSEAKKIYNHELNQAYRSDSESKPTEQDEKADFVVSVPKNTSPQKLMAINQLLHDSPGKQKGALFFKYNGDGKTLRLSFGVNFTKKLEKEIKKILTE